MQTCCLKMTEMKASSYCGLIIMLGKCSIQKSLALKLRVGLVALSLLFSLHSFLKRA